MTEQFKKGVEKMAMRLVKSFMFLLMFALLLAGCSENNENSQQNTTAENNDQQEGKADSGEGGVSLVFGTVKDTPSLDPFLDAADERTKRTVLLYEGLTWVDHTMTAQPRLAKSWDVSEDGTLYTFHLRDDVYFHNGQKMTAEDVKYSYDLFLDPDFETGGSGDFSAVEEIRVVDENTVEFKLKYPFSALLASLGGRYGGVVPKGTYDNGADLRNTEVGTGPYTLAEWNRNNRMVLKKFDKYWNKDSAFVDEMIIQIVPDQNSLIAGLRTGQIDLAVLGDPRDYELIKDLADLTVERHPALRWATLDFANDTAPVNDVRVRQAIAKAIDKEEVMKAATGGVGTVIGTMPSAFGEWVVPREQLPNQKRDVEGAKQLLAEAGYANGFDLPLRIISGYQWMQPAAEVVVSNLREVGINVLIDRVELGVWIEGWSSRQSPNTFNEWGGFTDPDLLYYRHFHKQPEGGDWRRWNNDEASRILDEARAAVSAEERKELYNQLQALMAEQVPTIPLFSPDEVVAYQKNIKDYVHHPSGWWYGLQYVKK
jgi:peptide/nickel transport system substrate-binding protein